MRHLTFLSAAVLASIVIFLAAPATALAYGHPGPPCEPPFVPGPPQPDPSLDKEVAAGILGAQRAFREAYYQMDAAALSALFHEKAVFAGTLHPYWMEGPQKIQELWAFYFGIYGCPKIVFWSSSLRDLLHNPHSRVVGQHATVTMLMPDRTGQVRYVNMRLSVIWVRVDQPYRLEITKGKPDTKSFTLHWKIAHIHGSEAPPSR